MNRTLECALMGCLAAAAVPLGCGDDGQPIDATRGSTTEVSGTSETSQTDTGSSSDSTAASESSATVGSSSGELPIVDYETDVQPIWNAGCLCHLQGGSGTMTAPFLTLNPGVSYGELVAVASEQAEQLDRVVAGDASASYLWHKLAGTHLDLGGSGDAMPPTGALTPDELELVNAWIAGGALP